MFALHVYLCARARAFMLAWMVGWIVGWIGRVKLTTRRLCSAGRGRGRIGHPEHVLIVLLPDPRQDTAG